MSWGGGRTYGCPFGQEDRNPIYGRWDWRYTYYQIGDMIWKKGLAHRYPSSGQARLHAMTTRGGQAVAWDVENRVASVAGESHGYDGDGKGATRA